jgi:hypothetical protein
LTARKVESKGIRKEVSMLAKLTSKNQLTLPKAILSQIQASEYFTIGVENGCIVLTPAVVHSANAVRDKLQQLGITEEDIPCAVEWARKGSL